MNNLSIENLSGGMGDLETLGGGGGATSERQVLREMAKNGLSSGASGSGAESAPSAAGEAQKTFSNMLRDSFDQVNLHQKQADQSIKELVSGRSKNIHETLLTIERADASLKLAMQVRNKILDAYREIMRMQV